MALYQQRLEVSMPVAGHFATRGFCDHRSQVWVHEFGVDARLSLAGPPTGSIAGSGLPPQTLLDPAIGNLLRDAGGQV